MELAALAAAGIVGSSYLDAKHHISSDLNKARALINIRTSFVSFHSHAHLLQLTLGSWIGGIDWQLMHGGMKSVYGILLRDKRRGGEGRIVMFVRDRH